MLGKKDHELGPPHTYIFGGLLRAICDRGEKVGMKSAKDFKALTDWLDKALPGAEAVRQGPQ